MDRWQAEAVVNAAHAAWSARNLEQVLELYCEDIVYTCNGMPDGQPVRFDGREAMRGFLAPVLDVAESASVVSRFVFDAGVARTQVACFVRHKKTKIVLSGSFRQIIRFSGTRISRLDEFHDAAKLNAFWRLVAQSEQDLLERDEDRSEQQIP
jgi:ketosteroid isomerase-like protein